MGNLPANDLSRRELWPTPKYTLPELQPYPQKLNRGEELLALPVPPGPRGIPRSGRTWM